MLLLLCLHIFLWHSHLFHLHCSALNGDISLHSDTYMNGSGSTTIVIILHKGHVFLKPFISFICSQEIKKDQCNVFCFCFLVNNAPSRSSSVLWNSIRLCWCQKTTLLYLAPKLTMTFCCHLHFKATPVAQSQPHPTELSTSRYLFCIMSLALYLSFAFIVPLFFSCIIQH